MPSVKLRNHLLVILLCLAIAAFVATAIDPNEIGMNHDDGIYAILGKSLSEGKGLRLINLPSSPYQVKYPPVYPFLMSFIWQLVEFPQNIFWFKLMNVAFLFLILLQTYYISLMLLGGGKFLPILVTILVGTSAWISFFAITAFSELPYMFFSLSAVLIILMAEKQETLGVIDSQRYLFYSLAILCGSLAYQTRTIGLSLLLAIIIYFLIKKKHLAAIYALALILALNLPWILWARAHTPGMDINPLLHYYTGYIFPVSEIKSFSGLIAYLKVVVLPNMWYLCEHVSAMVSNISIAVKSLVAPVIIVLAAGAWKSWRRGDNLVIHLYLVFYTAMFLCYPSLPSSRLRYMIPLAPFLFVIFCRGAMVFYEQLVASARQYERIRVYSMGAFLILLLPNLMFGTRYIASAENDAWDGFEETIAWIKENTNKNAILACTWDPVYYLYAGRVTVRPWFENVLNYYYSFPEESGPFVGNPEYCFSLLKELNVGYLIVEPLSGAEKKPVMTLYSGIVEKHKDELKLVFVSKDKLHKIYRLQKISSMASADNKEGNR